MSTVECPYCERVFDPTENPVCVCGRYDAGTEAVADGERTPDPDGPSDATGGTAPPGGRGTDVGANDDLPPDMVTCSNCKAEVHDQPYCTNCGASLQDEGEDDPEMPVCEECGAETGPDDAYCSSCGAALDGANGSIGSPPRRLVLDVMGNRYDIEDGKTIGATLRTVATNHGYDDSEAKRVSRKHAQFTRRSDGFYVTHRGRNGLKINGTPMSKDSTMKIAPGDTLEFANVVEGRVERP
jgi:hypothetical protein